MTQLTKPLVLKLIETIDAGLSRGLGNPVPGEMCIEAAVCYALGQEHSDKPICVSEVLRTFKIRLNDFHWSSNTSRAKGLKRLGIAQLGTNDPSIFNEQKFLKLLVKEAANWAAEATRAANWAAEATRAARAAKWAAEAARAARTAEAATEAAETAVWAAKAAEAARAARTAKDTRDKVLSQCAEDVVQILIKMKTPGSKFLYLAPVV